MDDIEGKILQFLKEWLEWAENGAPEHPYFETTMGLCICAINYRNMGMTLHYALPEFLPFYENATPFGIYHTDSNAGTMHENPKRLAWVRKTIAELEKDAV